VSINTTITESLHSTAAELLSEGKVAVVIGYGSNGESFSPPLFVRKPEEAQRLVFDDRCFGNLAVYLSKDTIRNLGKIGIVVTHSFRSVPYVSSATRRDATLCLATRLNNPALTMSCVIKMLTILTASPWKSAGNSGADN